MKGGVRLTRKSDRQNYVRRLNFGVSETMDSQLFEASKVLNMPVASVVRMAITFYLTSANYKLMKEGQKNA